MKIAVAVSGGIDSLYAAYLLKEAGHRVVALHMSLTKVDHSQIRNNYQQAATISRLETLFEIVGIKDLVILDAGGLFEEEVIQPFLNAYLKGVTPNPCILCNAKVKFGFLLDYALNKLKADKFATGHYARISPSPYAHHRLSLQKGADLQKDQSYFLYAINHAKLQHVLFPLANRRKDEILTWSIKNKITHLVPEESQEICFVAGRRYTEFMEDRLPSSLLCGGPIKDLEGRLLGYHKGIHHYTIGQRRGLGIPSTEPYYVVKIDPDTNTVFVGRKKDVFKKVLYATEVIWGAMEPDEGSEIECFVQIRQQHTPAKAVVRVKHQSTVKVIFETKQPAVTPGQAAVFYDKNGFVLGGGTITENPDANGSKQ